MPKEKLEEFLLPWEKDKDGKKLDEPAEIDVERLRKYVYGVLTDKENAQAARDEAVVAKEGVENELAELRRQNETDEQRRKREQEERDAEFERMKKEAAERRKVEALEDHFKDKGITSARAKRLAKRIGPEVDEKDWITEAEELVEDGFRITDKVASTTKTEKVDDEDDETEPPEELVPVRRATRNGRTVVPEDSSRKRKTVEDELDAAGITLPGWG